MHHFIKLILLSILFLTNGLWAKTPPTEKVSLQLQWKYQFQFAGFIMAKEKGFYKNLGLDVHIKEWKQNIKMVDEVINKTSTYAVARPTSLIDISNGKDIVLLSTIYQSSPLVLLSTKESNIKSIKDFKNKNIMSTGDLNTDASIISMMFSQGIDIKDLKLQPPSFDVKDLISKKTDLMSSYISNEPYLLKELGVEPVIFNPKDFGFDFYNDIVITSREQLNNNSEQVQKFTQASLQGWEYAFANIQESVNTIFEKYNTQNKTKEALLYEAQELKKLAYYKTTKIGKIEKNKLEKIYDVYKLLGLASKSIDFDKIIYKNTASSVMLTSQEKEWIANNTIKIGISPWYPISYYNDDKTDIEGIGVEIINKIAKKVNLKFEYVPKKWNVLLEEFKAHELDLLPTTFYTKERATYGDFTEKYLDIKEQLYVKKTSTIHGFDDLKGQSLAMLKSYGGIHKIKKKYPSIKIIEVDTLEESIKMVLNDQAQAIFNMQFGVDAFLKKHYIYGLKAIYQTDFKSSPLHFFTNSNKPILNRILQKGLNQLTFEEKNNIVSTWINEESNDLKSNSNLNLTFSEKVYLKNNPIIKMCNNPDWAPLEFVEDGELKGIAPDSMKIIEKKLNLKFKYVKTEDWTQSQEFLKDKKCDILSSATQTSQRESYALFTQPYLDYKLAFITKNDKPFIESINDIIDKPLARKKGSGLISKLKNEYKDVTIIETKSSFDTMQRISNGEVYATIETLPVASYYFNKYAFNDLHVAGYANMRYKLSIAVRDDKPILRNILNKALYTISKEEKDSIYKKWVNISINEAMDYTLVWYSLIFVSLIIFFFMYKQHMLRKSLKEFHELIDATMEAIVVFKNGLSIDANQSALNIFEYDSKEEMLGRKAIEFVAPQSKELVLKNMKVNDSEPYEGKLLKKDGSEFDALIRGYDLKNANMRISGIIDISVLKQQEKLLVEQSRMVAMGEMIGNIAHQWRQPLSVISTGTTGMLLQKEYGSLSDESFIKTCESINKNAQYLSKTIDDFKDFIKGDRKKTSFYLSNEVHSFLSLIEGSIKRHDIKIVLNLDDTVHFEGYPNELVQCFMNMYNNAKDALLDMKTTRYIFVTTSVQKAEVIISIKDNAGGIKESVIDKIFDPYFTTKHQSKGTGIGLSMTYNLIVDGMKGSIEAKNVAFMHQGEKCQGAEFIITLPAE